MLKILGGCMIFSGCLGLGMWYSTQLRGRIKAVRNLRNILELLAGEIGYGRATLPECCTHTARYLHPPFDQAFCRIGERMEENMGVSFGEVFREEMEKTLSVKGKRQRRFSGVYLADRVYGQPDAASSHRTEYRTPEAYRGKATAGKCGEKQNGSWTGGNGRFVIDFDSHIRNPI